MAWATAVQTGDVRLNRIEVSEEGGAAAGRVEVFTGSGWGTVCAAATGGADGASSFSAAAAGVVCRQLGFAEGAQIQSTVRLPALCCAVLCSVPMWLWSCGSPVETESRPVGTATRCCCAGRTDWTESICPSQWPTQWLRYPTHGLAAL